MELIRSGMVLPLTMLLLLPALFYVKWQRIRSSTTTSTSPAVQTIVLGASRLRCVPVRQLQPEELCRLKDFLLLHWGETAINYKNLVKLSTYVWIIENNHNVLACAWAVVDHELSCHGDSWILCSICVHTKVRRRGLCRIMMGKIEEDAKQQQIWQMVLWVDVDLEVKYALNKSWRINMYHREFRFEIVNLHEENLTTCAVCMAKPLVKPQLKPLPAPTACAAARR
jgi:hypothetical protein